MQSELPEEIKWEVAASEEQTPKITSKVEAISQLSHKRKNKNSKESTVTQALLIVTEYNICDNLFKNLLK